MCVCDISTLMAAGCKCGDIKNDNAEHVLNLVNRILAFDAEVDKLEKISYPSEKDYQNINEEYEKLLELAGPKYYPLIRGVEEWGWEEFYS